MLTADRLVGGLVLLKAVDPVVRGPLALPGPLWAAVLALWVGGGSALVLAAGAGRPRRGAWGAVVAGGAGLAVDLPLELRRQHLVLLVLVALAAVVARDVGERLLLWRVQLSALYGAAALAKLNESFLGGDVLAGSVARAPVWSSLLPLPPPTVLVLASVGLVATEALLAVCPWRPAWRVPGALAAGVLHLVALVLVADSTLVALRLAVFGGTAVVLHAAGAGLVRTAAPAAR